jgi:hypothetical protein
MKLILRFLETLPETTSIAPINVLQLRGILKKFISTFSIIRLTAYHLKTGGSCKCQMFFSTKFFCYNLVRNLFKSIIFFQIRLGLAADFFFYVYINVSGNTTLTIILKSDYFFEYRYLIYTYTKFK